MVTFGDGVEHAEDVLVIWCRHFPFRRILQHYSVKFEKMHNHEYTACSCCNKYCKLLLDIENKILLLILSMMRMMKDW